MLIQHGRPLVSQSKRYRPAASMGPCLFSMEDFRRGRIAECPRCSFNGAMLIQHGRPPGQERRTSRPQFRASMGPCLFSMEDTCGQKWSSADRLASMGPCLFSMEDPKGIVGKIDYKYASMGPCLFSMEDILPGTNGVAYYYASMGPCLFSMEDLTQFFDERRPDQRFNGAMLIQHGRRSGEIGIGRNPSCFNGAMLIQHGRQVSQSPPSPAPYRFNGAMLIQHGRPQLRVLHPVAWIASMGPCLFSMEDNNYHFRNNFSKWLQWGHAYSAWKTLGDRKKSLF